MTESGTAAPTPQPVSNTLTFLLSQPDHLKVDLHVSHHPVDTKSVVTKIMIPNKINVAPL